MICVLVDRRQCTALVDTSCSKNTEVLTTNGKITWCHGTNYIELVVGHMCPLHLEILGLKGKLLGFDLLLGFDAIKKLGEGIVHLTESGEIHFLVEK